YGMRLPSGGFHQFLQGCPARPLQQFQDFGGLATVAGGTALLFALRRFLARAGLLPRLRLLRRNVRATCASWGLFRSFRLRSRAGGRRFRFCVRDHVSPLAVITAVTT